MSVPGWLRADPSAPGWRVPVVAWAASRALILLLGLVLSLWFGLPTRGVDPAVPHQMALLGGWDTTWYLDIARHGYTTDTADVGQVFTNLAFFPLLPGVMAAFLAIGVNPFWGALAVANLAMLVALWALHALTRARAGERAAAAATWTLALFPPALYCSLPYTEGIAVAAAIGAALLAVRGRFAIAGLVAGVAALTRPTGALVALLVGLLALYRPAPGRLRRLAAAVLPAIVAVGCFLGWMAAERGSALLPLDAQKAWDRGQVGVGIVTELPREIGAGWDLVASATFTAAWHATLRDLAFLGLYAWLLVLLWRREGGLRSPWVVYSAAALLIPLSSGTITSTARFGLMAFPLMWPLADRVAALDPRRRAWLVAGAVAVIALGVAQLTMRSP
ncbi:MAG: hypothetical protein AB7V42_13955 [Thermoleophilia bacterium]